VATCANCGRPICVGCAVPIRGVAYGQECLTQVLGDDAPEPAAAVPLRSALDRGIGAALAVASVVTVMPWTRFGTGSRWFRGAWSTNMRWSILPACAAVIGLAAWLVLGRGRPVPARLAGLVAGGLIAAGSLLAILNPPPFTKPALAPWIALLSGLAAATLAGLARPWTKRPPV
jgi:hypothetical protein